MTTDSAVLLVTGASSGIGRTTAEEASRRGFHLVLAARDPGALDDVRHRCREASSVTAVPTDVSDDVAVRSCIDQTLSTHGRIDAVIHCAALIAYGRTEQIPVDVSDAVIGANLLGSINLVRHVLPLMRERDHGTLVLIGSVIGHLTVPEMTPYVVSKWGVRALARQLQVENRDRSGVHICYLAPGAVDTPIYRNAADYSGLQHRPPLPTSSPERIARRALRQLDRPRARTQVGPFNRTLRFGFSYAPRLFDAAVGPIIDLTGAAESMPGRTTTGNVFDSSATSHRTRSGQGPLASAVLKGLAGGVRAMTKRKPDA